MRKSLILLTTAAALSFAIAGNAQPLTTHSSQAGAYAGIGLGYGGMDTPELDSAEKNRSTSSSEDIGGAAGRVYGGYLWQVSNFLIGPEVGYNAYSNNEYKLSDGVTTSNLTYSGYTIDLLGVVKYPFANGFNVFGKAGIAYTSQKIEFDGNAPGISFSQSKTNTKTLPKVAVGAGYNWTNQFSTNVTYSHSFGNAPSSFENVHSLDDLYSVASVDVVLVNAEYHFG